MFAKDVLRVLQVSRPTLTKYVKTGIIRVHVMPNGHYDFASGYTINGVFSDIVSGITFEKRKGLFELLDDVLAGRVERVVVA